MNYKGSKSTRKIQKNFPKILLSIDSRKSLVMDFSIKNKVDIINDVLRFKFDPKSFNIVKNKNLWKIIHHMQGTPQTMQLIHHIIMFYWIFMIF